MKLRIASLALLGFSTMIVPAWAQPNPLRLPQPSAGAAGPDRPVRPQMPTLVPRVRQLPPEQSQALPQPPPPPFTLTPPRNPQLDRVLNLWEQRNRDVKTFDCKFKCRIYDSIFHPPEPNQPLKPAFIEIGVIKYAAADCGLFRVELEEKDGKEIKV